MLDDSVTCYLSAINFNNVNEHVTHACFQQNRLFVINSITYRAPQKSVMCSTRMLVPTMTGEPAKKKIKLTYLDAPGVAEATRLAFFIGEVPFEDERISYDEVKKRRAANELPYGQTGLMQKTARTVLCSLVGDVNTRSWLIDPFV